MVDSVPYGYKKSPHDKRLLIIDEERAPVIRKIFEIAKQGNGISKIRQIMTDEKVLRPSYIIFKNMQTFHVYFEDENDPKCYTA